MFPSGSVFYELSADKISITLILNMDPEFRY